MFIVDDDGAECPNAAFTSVQAAVAAAGPGDQVKVCPGLYQEQVTIPAGKDRLTLFSQVPLAAVIKAPQPVMADPGDIVHVAGAHDVSLRQFTIAGPLPDSAFCSLFTRTGVRVDGGGSATIYGNHITEIRSTTPALRGCQNGIGVLVGRFREGQVGTAVVRNNLIDRYQKGGIVVDGPGSYGEIRQNEVIGSGPTDVIAQNGIQVSRDAHADVSHNEVSLNQFGLPPVATDIADASGIILYNLGPGVTADHNDVFENEDGIVLFAFPGDGHVGPTTGVEVLHNNTRRNVLDGLDAFEDTAANELAYNKSLENGLFDCADFTIGPGTAGTANFWIKDMGLTENRPGLCKAPPGKAG
jgi:hypothetical protein